MRTKRFRLTSAILSGALMLTVPALAAAQDAKQQEVPDEIVVTGQVEHPPAVVRQQARSITQNFGAIYREPLAQFQDPICPGVIGMPRNLAEIMVDRIRMNAEKIGLDTAKEGKCRPNIVVAFVRNGHDTIKELKAKQGYLFKNITMNELKKLAADKGPVHAWVNTLVRSRQGDALQGDPDKMSLMSPPVLNVANSQSHIFLASRLDITKSIVMLDIQAINGMSAVQIADYATMRAFARTRPVDGDAAVSTILSLFDPESVKPIGLTDFDIAYLRTIYGGIPNINAASKLAHINQELREQQAERQAQE